MKIHEVAKRLAQWETIATIAKAIGIGEGGVRYYIRVLKIKYGGAHMPLEDLRLIIKKLEGVHNAKN